MTNKNAETRRKPTAKDWDKVRAMYMRSESLDYIIKQFPDVEFSKNYIMKKMSLEGVTAKKKAIQDKVIDNLANIAEEEKIAVNNECIRLFNNGSKVIDGLLNQYIGEVREGNIPKTQARATAYNIDLLMSGVTKIQKGLRVAYGMDETGKLYEKEPEVLVIEGFNPEKI